MPVSVSTSVPTLSKPLAPLIVPESVVSGPLPEMGAPPIEISVLDKSMSLAKVVPATAPLTNHELKPSVIVPVPKAVALLPAMTPFENVVPPL